MNAYEYDNETACYTKDEEVVDKIRDYWCYKKVSDQLDKHLRMF
jgi:hypothetical protein